MVTYISGLKLSSWELSTWELCYEKLCSRMLSSWISKLFVSMTDSLRRSKKPILRALLSETQHDARSNTGKNRREIMIQTSRSNISNQWDTSIGYRKYPILWAGRGWRVEGGDAEASFGGAREEPSGWRGSGVAELSLLWLTSFTNYQPQICHVIMYLRIADRQIWINA